MSELRFADGIPDADAYLELEWLASEPYSRFVYGGEPQERKVARALLAAHAGEFAPPFGRAILDRDGVTVAMVAGPLLKSDLARARFAAARALMKTPELIAGDVTVRSKAAQSALLRPNDGDAYLSRIAVRAECRGRGVAAFALESFLESARQRGATRAVLEVSPEHQSAIRLYERFGFAPGEEHRAESEQHVLVYRHMTRTL